jgi:hypothetical protein
MPLISRVEETVIALHELLMTLKEIHDLIAHLWKIVLSWLLVKQIVFNDSFANAIETVSPELME